MFVINDDKSIYVTRGDILFFSVTAKDNDVTYTFRAGDLVRIKVYGKKDAENVVLQKDFPVTEETEEVAISLTEEDTKFGEVISKPVDYWYEVELNPLSDPQTIIGYDEDGAKIFRLFPEGADIDPYEPDPADIPVVDEELDLTSERPVRNYAITKAILEVKEGIRKLHDKIYPVGAIYLSVTEVDPAALFGGTWERLKDRFLLGAGDQFAAGEEDGESSVILGADQIPYHSHEVSYMIEGEGTTRPEGHTLLAGSYETAVGQMNTMYITGGGEDRSHNNMPPYLAVYMWKRIA